MTYSFLCTITCESGISDESSLVRLNQSTLCSSCKHLRASSQRYRRCEWCRTYWCRNCISNMVKNLWSHLILSKYVHYINSPRGFIAGTLQACQRQGRSIKNVLHTFIKRLMTCSSSTINFSVPSPVHSVSSFRKREAARTFRKSPVRHFVGQFITASAALIDVDDLTRSSRLSK